MVRHCLECVASGRLGAEEGAAALRSGGEGLSVGAGEGAGEGTGEGAGEGAGEGEALVAQLRSASAGERQWLAAEVGHSVSAQAHCTLWLHS